MYLARVVVVSVYLTFPLDAGVSCMAPEGFKNRFQQKVSRIIEHSIFVREVTGSWFGKRCVIAFESCELAICIYLSVCMCLYVYVSSREVTEPSRLLLHTN